MKKKTHSLLFITVSLLLALSTNAVAETVFSPAEKTSILSHAPWPPSKSADLTNRFSEDAAAASIGARLFRDKGLSPSAKFSCADCHNPDQHFADGLETANALGRGFRNTPSLVNARYQHWYGWAGSVDTLWGASLRAILNPLEMAGSALSVSDYISSRPGYNTSFEQLIGSEWTQYSADEKLVTVGKFLAAYMEDLISPASPFDHFVEALVTKNNKNINLYPDAAIRGLKLFVGKGRCNLCHFGPLFSNLEFADIGIPYFVKPGIVDKGRYQGIKDLKISPYSSLGPYSDDTTGDASILSRHIAFQHRNWGEFKVPTLRGVSKTPPYMHNGSLATLRDVINHYSDLDEERLHVDGATILRPLNLTRVEKNELLAFLNTL